MVTQPVDKLPLTLYLLALTGTVAYFVYAVIRYRRELSSPSVEARYSVPSYVANTLGLFFLLVSLPFYYTKWRDIPEIFLENPAFLFFVLFTFIGLGFLFYGLRKTIKGMKVSSEVVVEREDLAPGGVLSGIVRLKGLEAVREPLKISLVLQQAYVVSHREKRIGEKPVWSQSAETYPVIFKNSTEIPFKFDLRDDFPPEDSWEEGYELALVVEGKNFGVKTFFLKTKGEPIGEVPEDFLGAEGIKSAGEIMAEREYKNPWNNILPSSFVVLFALFMWFLITDGYALKDPVLGIKRFIGGGAVGVIVFFLPIYKLGLKIKSKDAEGIKSATRWIVRIVVALIVLVMLLWGYALYDHFLGEGKHFETIAEFMTSTLLEGLLGMFFIVGIYGVLVGFKDLISRSSHAMP